MHKYTFNVKFSYPSEDEQVGGIIFLIGFIKPFNLKSRHTACEEIKDDRTILHTISTNINLLKHCEIRLSPHSHS